MIPANIQLIRFGAAAANLAPSQQNGWPLTVQAQGENIPSEIFVYQRVDPNDPTPGDVFHCIASLNDLYELPKGRGTSKNSTTGIPFYRRAQAEFICRSASEADEVWCSLKAQVQDLIANFNNSCNLQGIEFVKICDDTQTTNFSPMNAPQFVQIAYQPAGTATLISDVQGITSPNLAMQGWLPASSAPGNWIKPAGAFLYYNIAEDPTLTALWPPGAPMQATQFFKNGLLLPYGITHVYTKDTIWWLAFDPSTLPGYAHIDSEIQDGNAPWPVEYVSPINTGPASTILTLTIYK